MGAMSKMLQQRVYAMGTMLNLTQKVDVMGNMLFITERVDVIGRGWM